MFFISYFLTKKLITVKKILQRSIACLLLLISLSPSAIQAQSYCPVQYYNNSGTIGLTITQDLYDDFEDGNYLLWFISSERYDCINFVEEPVYIAKTTSLQSTISCAPSVKGLTFTFSSPLCGGQLADNELHTGAISIYITTTNQEDVLLLDYYDNEPGSCDYYPFNLTSPARKVAAIQSAANTRTKLYDLYGNFRKAVNMKSTDTRLDSHTLGLPAGMYYAQVEAAGQQPARRKVWVDK